MIHEFKYQTLVLFKGLLLQPKVWRDSISDHITYWPCRCSFSALGANVYAWFNFPWFHWYPASSTHFKTAQILHLTLTRRLSRSQPHSRRVIEVLVSCVSGHTSRWSCSQFLLSVGIYGSAFANFWQGSHRNLWLYTGICSNVFFREACLGRIHLSSSWICLQMMGPSRMWWGPQILCYCSKRIAIATF